MVLQRSKGLMTEPQSRDPDQKLGEQLHQILGGLQSGPLGAASREEAVEDPDSQLGMMLQARLEGPSMVPESGMKRPTFGEGFVEGLVYPFRLFRDNPEDEIDHTIAQGFSLGKLAGEFTGMAVSFLPYWKGAQFGLRGLGLTQRLTTHGERVARGAVSLGLYEGGAAETAEDVPSRMILGAAFGAATESAFIQGARLWRNRHAPPNNWDIHPDALRLEMAMRPNPSDDPSKVVNKLRELKTHRAQLDYSTARFAALTSTFETVLVPGVRNPRQLEEAVKRLRPEMQVHRRFVDNQWEVLVHDPTKTRPVELTSRRMTTDPDKLFEEAALIVAGGGDMAMLDIPPINVYSFGRTSQLPQRMQSAGSDFAGAFFANLPDTPIAVRANLKKFYEKVGAQLRTGVEAWDRVSTLVHEYIHAWHHHALGRFPVSTIFPDLFPQTAPNTPFTLVVRQLAGVDPFTPITADMILALPDDPVREFIELAVENLALRVTGPRADAIVAARRHLASDFDAYFGTEMEVLAWAGQMMFLDPARARQIAPNVTKVLSDKMIDSSNVMQELFKFDARFRNIDEHLKGHWVTFGDEARFFRDYRVDLSRKQANQWKAEGAYSGMQVLHGGEWVEYIGRVGVDPDSPVRIRFTKTGQVKQVPANSIQRPVFAQMVVRDRALSKAIDKAMTTPLRNLMLTVRDEAKQGVQRAAVALDNMIPVENLHTYLRGVRKALEEIPLPPEISALSPTEQMYWRLSQHLRNEGKAGLVMDDNGVMRIFMADENAMTVGQHIISPEFNMPVDYMLPTEPAGYRIITPGWVSTVESRLAQAGVSAADMPFFVSHALEHTGKRLTQLIDPDLWGTYRAALGRFRELTPTVKENLKAAGIKVEQTAGKKHTAKNASDATIASVDTMEELGVLASKVTPEGYPNLDSASPIPTEVLPSGGGLGSPPKAHAMLKTMSTAEGAERATSLVQLYTAAFTAMENIAKSMENLGLGPLYTKVYLPTQRAMTNVKNQMHVVSRPELGGKTVIGYLQDIQKKAKKMGMDRQEKVIDYIEFMTRDEISSPGGFLQRGMNARELKAATEIEKLGLTSDMPRLLATDRLVRSYLHSQTRYASAANQLRRAAEVDPTLLQILDRLDQGTKDLKNVTDVMDFLGLSKEERFGLKLINDAKRLGVDKFSLPAVIRYVEAPTLPKGFKSGRDWFAQTHKMSPLEVQTALDIERVLGLGFRMAGLDPKRQLGGYWPHLRRMSEQGFVPTDGYLRKGIPEAMDWASARIRTGEIDLYDKDIFLTPYRYMRGLLMKEHFDPILPEVRDILGALKVKDHRAWRLMDEYVNDLMGIPHSSFKKLNQVIEGFARMIGKEIQPRTAENIVNLMTSLTYGATIPFRPALIARNWFQAVQTIPARTGWESFMDGVHRALKKENFDELVKKGIIPIHQAPLHATSEVFDPRNLKLTRSMQNLVDRGFRWYKTADDFGRAMAYYAQKHRIAKYKDAVMTGKISWDDFLQKAKVKTFGDADVSEFTRLWREGQFEAAGDHLGAVLARETHFRYGDANRPAGWGGVAGRLFGQFGTWPVQYKDFVMQGLSRGSTKDKIEFATWVATTNMGIVAAGAAVGLDLSGWVNFSSLNYTGGPYANMAVSAVKAWGGTDQEKALARRTLSYAFPSLEHPQSIFVPGSYLLGDITSAFEQRTFGEAVIRGGGFRFLEGQETGFVERLLFE
jgi:hypothetical protein